MTWQELAPWMLLGMLLAGLMHVLVPPQFFRRQLQGTWGVVKSVVLGIPLPLCSCGVIPAGVGLKKNGASDGAAIGFLISTPQTGVDSILVSGSFLGWPFALFKMGAALVTGVVGGIAVNGLGSRQPVSAEFRAGEALDKRPRRWTDIGRQGIDILRSIGLWLVVGVAISAAISLWLPRTWTSAVADWGLWASMLLILVISLPWYICATASVPIAASLVDAGFPTAAALVFLMAGPATNVATLGAVLGTFGGRVLVIYLCVIIAGSMLGGWLFESWLGQLTVRSTAHGHHHGAEGWFAAFCGWVLAFMVIGVATQSVLRRWRTWRQPQSDAAPLSLQIEGMHCQNCAQTLEAALRRAGPVERITIDIGTGQTHIFGHLAHAQIEAAVRQCGFRIVNPL